MDRRTINKHSWTELADKPIHSLYLDYSFPSPIVPMAPSINLPSLKVPLLHKSHFLGPINLFKVSHKPFLTTPKPGSTIFAKFTLRNPGRQTSMQWGRSPPRTEKNNSLISSDQETSAISTIESIREDGFEKELLGLVDFQVVKRVCNNSLRKINHPQKSPAGTWSQLGSIRA